MPFITISNVVLLAFLADCSAMSSDKLILLTGRALFRVLNLQQATKARHSLRHMHACMNLTKACTLQTQMHACELDQGTLETHALDTLLSQTYPNQRGSNDTQRAASVSSIASESLTRLWGPVGERPLIRLLQATLDLDASSAASVDAHESGLIPPSSSFTPHCCPAIHHSRWRRTIWWMWAKMENQCLLHSLWGDKVKRLYTHTPPLC